MLYIVLSCGTASEKEVKWNVGKFNPVPTQFVHKVCEVQADGDELDYLISRFPFILNNMPKKRSKDHTGGSMRA